MRRKRTLAAVAVVGALVVPAISAAPALAGGILGTGIGPSIGPNLPGLVCKVAGTVGEGWLGSACNAAEKAAGIAGKAKHVIGKVAGSPVARRLAGIAAITAAALGGARFVLSHMSSIISHSSEPAVGSSWFRSRYLQLEALAVLLTLPFLAAAAIQALLRQDLAVLARAAFAYLPLAALATAFAVPLTMMLLAVSDQLSGILARAAGQDAQHFFKAPGAIVAAALATAIDPFIAGLAACLVVAGGLAVWVELELRAVAVYVVVMMLPLVFAVMVWPSRRVWATRAVELLVAMIFAKIAIVAVLSIGAAAIGHGGGNIVVKVLAGIALLALGAFAPWILLRLIPLAEIASTAVGHVRGHVHAQTRVSTPEQALAGRAAEHAAGWSDALLTRMRTTAQNSHTSPAPPADPPPSPPQPATTGPPIAAPACGDGQPTAADPATAPAPAPTPASTAPAARPPNGNGTGNGRGDGWEEYARSLPHAGTPPARFENGGGSPAANGPARGWHEFADILSARTLPSANAELPAGAESPDPPAADSGPDGGL